MILRLVLLVVFACSVPAFAQKETGKEHFDRGMVFFNLQDYASAATEFKAAYTADPSKTDYLFTLGQAQRLGGDYAAAIGSYKAFLRTASGKSGAAAEGLIHVCENEITRAKAERLAAEKAAADKAAADKAAADADAARRAEEAKRVAVVAPTDAPKAVAPPTRVEEHRGWYADGLGAALFIPGVLGVGAGATFLILGNGEVTSSTKSTNLVAHDKLVSTGQTKQVIGVVALAAGGAVLAGSVVRYLVVGASDSKPVVSLLPTAGGAAAVVAGTF